METCPKVVRKKEEDELKHVSKVCKDKGIIEKLGETVKRISVIAVFGIINGFITTAFELGMSVVCAHVSQMKAPVPTHLQQYESGGKLIGNFTSLNKDDL